MPPPVRSEAAERLGKILPSVGPAQRDPGKDIGGSPGKEAGTDTAGQIVRRDEGDAKAAHDVVSVDQELVAGHGKKAGAVGHAGLMVGAHPRRRGRNHIRQDPGVRSHSGDEGGRAGRRPVGALNQATDTNGGRSDRTSSQMRRIVQRHACHVDQGMARRPLQPVSRSIPVAIGDRAEGVGAEIGSGTQVVRLQEIGHMPW